MPFASAFQASVRWKTRWWRSKTSQFQAPSAREVHQTHYADQISRLSWGDWSFGFGASRGRISLLTADFTVGKVTARFRQDPGVLRPFASERSGNFQANYG